MHNPYDIKELFAFQNPFFWYFTYNLNENVVLAVFDGCIIWPGFEIQQLRQFCLDEGKALFDLCVFGKFDEVVAELGFADVHVWVTYVNGFSLDAVDEIHEDAYDVVLLTLWFVVLVKMIWSKHEVRQIEENHLLDLFRLWSYQSHGFNFDLLQALL